MSFKISKTWQAWDNIMNFLNAVISGDDKGVNLTGGQFSVGSPDGGYESAFGQGDSYPFNIGTDFMFHYNTANETGTTITGATDITDLIESDTGSTVDFFENNLSGEVILMGTDLPAFGVKPKWGTLGVVEPANIQGEYLNALDAWIQQSFMATGSDYPYTRTGWELNQSLSEQLRFGISLLNGGLNVSKRTLNINGVDYEKYWVRIRLVSPITTMPLLEQVKIHTSRTEINADGTIEFFGLSRGKTDVTYLSVANQASDPANENVVYFTGGLNGGVAKYVDNELSSTALDSRMLIVKLSDAIDTSTPLLVTYPYYVKGTGTGDIEFTIEYQELNSEFSYDTISEPEGTETMIDTIAVNSNLERRTVSFEVPINQTDIEVGGVVIVISRDARGSNPNDTLGNSVILTGEFVEGRRWKV